MAEYIEKYSRGGKRMITVKFHEKVKNFKRVETFKYLGQFFKIYLDKNNSVYKLERSEVSSWKEIMKGKRKIRVPDTFEVIPETTLLNKIKGNPYSIAIDKLTTHIEREQL